MEQNVLDGRKLSFKNHVLQEFQSVYECIDKINHFMSRAAIMSFVPLLSKILPESISKVNSTNHLKANLAVISTHKSGISTRWRGVVTIEIVSLLSLKNGLENISRTTEETGLEIC